jgi:hypothetical protein
MNELIKHLGHLAVHTALREGPRVIRGSIEEGKRKYESYRRLKQEEEFKKRQENIFHKR